MTPDFSKKTIDTLGKRAGFICSNPDCRVMTVGPNSIDNESTKIGEAAHIFGARLGAKRFNPEMTDAARSDITNAIWLCRNCHKIVDSDESKYSHYLLFKWREVHEEYITAKLGNRSDQLRLEELKSSTLEFSNYTPIIRRIVIDKPEGWEFMLVAELMRTLNKPLLRKLKDLRTGLYLREQNFIESEFAFTWIQNRISEITELIKPVEGLFRALSDSWGDPGVSGDEHEIHHVAKLFRDYINEVVRFEEKITFTVLPEEYRALQELLKNTVGSQIEKFARIPDKLDNVVEIVKTVDPDNPELIMINERIEFVLPDNWNEEFDFELENLKRKLLGNAT